MTAIELASRGNTGSGRDILRDLYEDEPLMMTAGVFLALLLVPVAAAGMVDTRTHLDVNIWIKPAKFLVALSVYCITLAFFARWLSPGFRRSRAYRGFMIVVTAAIAAEMAWIAGAATLGTASHFNLSNPLMAALYPLMGLLAALLTSATAVFAIGIARNRTTGLPPVVKEALVTGLALTLPLTLVTAGTMASMTGHAVGGDGLDSGGLWLMGWLRDAGDLRVPHFFATHAMHAIPLFGLAAASLTRRNRLTASRMLAAGYLTFVVWTFVEALSGRPFLPMIG